MEIKLEGVDIGVVMGWPPFLTPPQGSSLGRIVYTRAGRGPSRAEGGARGEWAILVD